MTLHAFAVSQPRLLLLALVLATAAAGALLLRRRRMRVTTLVSGLASMLLLALAAGGISAQLPVAPRVAVLVDVSPSTRTAPWRQVDYVQRVARRLAPGARIEIYPFADGAPAASSTDLKEIPVTRTRLPRVAADALLLFSDGRLEAPGSLPPVYPVRSSWRPLDARLERLTYSGPRALAYVINDGTSRRELRWGGQSVAIAAGRSQILERPAGGRLEARLDRGDAWPENDVAVLPPPQAPVLQRWWVGPGAPAGFIPMTPGELPGELTAFLSAGLVVLSEVPPQDLPPGAEEQLVRYLRDLGGSMLLICGEADYSAWRNHPLSAQLPLLPDPPEQQREWIVLLDASGSMAAATGEQSRWQLASRAAMQLVTGLPEKESVSIASFASAVRWLERGKAVAQVLRQPPPFLTVTPRGSTDLEPALAELAGRGGAGAMVLVLTDAQVSFKNLRGLGDSLRRAGLRVSILALDEGHGLPQLRALAEVTGGEFLKEADSTRWAASAARLAATAAPSRRQSSSLAMQWQGLQLPARTATPWNRAWLREGGELLAASTLGEARVPLAARWNAGLGSAAVAVTLLRPEEVQALVQELRRPQDPLLQVDWSGSAEGQVRLRSTAAAAGGAAYSLQVTPLEGQAATQTAALEPVGPGRYEGRWEPDLAPSAATISRGGRPVANYVLAGQAAPEFLGLGFDLGALQALADRTGGRMLDEEGPAMELPRRMERADLTPVLGALGAVLLLMTAILVRWEAA